MGGRGKRYHKASFGYENPQTVVSPTSLPNYLTNYINCVILLIMEQLTTPTGQYDLEELRKIASGIARRVNSSSLDYEDLYHDIVVSLLEGLTLPQACQGIKKKYKGWKKGPSIFVIPQELVSTDPREDNERILTDFERFEIQRQFFEILDQLTPNEKRLMIHVSLGFTNKEIAKCFGLSYGYVRKYKCETMKKMRSILSQINMEGIQRGTV